MGATMPETVGYLSDASVRICLHSALVLTGTSNTSSFTGTYAKLPPSTTPWLQEPAGILNRNFFDPNFFPMNTSGSPAANLPQGIDPSTINGVAWAAPYTGFGVGKALSVIIRGITFVYIAGGGTIASGDLLFCADQYGRVDNKANCGITVGAGQCYVLGRAQQAAAATANLLIQVDVNIQAIVY